MSKVVIEVHSREWFPNSNIKEKNVIDKHYVYVDTVEEGEVQIRIAHNYINTVFHKKYKDRDTVFVEVLSSTEAVGISLTVCEAEKLKDELEKFIKYYKEI